MIDDVKIRQAIALLKPDGALFEVRLLDDRNWNASGYFTDVDKMLPELVRMVKKRSTANVYFTLNNVSPECYSRQQRDKLIEYAKPSTSDNDIAGMDWLMIDFDPKRTTGTSSSDAQLATAKAKANEVFLFLRGYGWSNPVIALSGNGAHLLYAIRLKNTPDNVTLLQRCLEVVNMLFSDEQVDIDLKTFNPSRICKLYGTVAHKGADTTENPHRMSGIVRDCARGADGKPEPVDRALLEKLVSLLPQEQKPERYNGYSPGSFDLRAWITKHGLRVKEYEWANGWKFVFDECPFNPEHKAKDAAIFLSKSGAIGFKCFHNSCSQHGWRDLRLLYEPDAYDRQYVQQQRRPNYKDSAYVPPRIAQKNDVDGTPVFYTTEQIRVMRRPPEEFIQTGINVIDSKMRGLKKGFVTCLTGLRGSGKSSIVSQLAIEAADQGYRTALFSGELTAKNTYDWLVLQTAGKFHVHETQYENYYRPDQETEKSVSEWLNGKVFIYNNDYGNEFIQLMDNLNKCVEDHRVDLIILDNLMALDIESLDYDKFQRQSVFVKVLENYAKAANIHILFVAHPRKTQGFLRLDDVSGTGEITARVDNAFIIHRVNKDFERLSKQYGLWREGDAIYRCDNVIEVCKDRDLGNQDLFIPLYFDKTCKRLKNDEYEHKVYGWEETYVNESLTGV